MMLLKRLNMMNWLKKVDNTNRAKKHRICEKDYIWNPATCSCEKRKYLPSIIDDSVITYDKIIEETNTVPTNFNENKLTCKTQSVYILLAFY